MVTERSIVSLCHFLGALSGDSARTLFMHNTSKEEYSKFIRMHSSGYKKLKKKIKLLMALKSIP